MKNRIKNTAEILPDFSGLILTEDKANAPLPLKISWGNSWLARWTV